jgi:hypothetical protein
MWPTPTANNYESEPEVFLPRREREKAKGRNGNGFGLTLGMAVRLWPTPQARDGQGRSTPSEHVAASRYEDGKRCLEDAVALNGAPGGMLNPTWVEWLMGFPAGWTDCGP